MDPFVATVLLMLGMALVLVPPLAWLFPKVDRALGRLSDYLDSRKAR
jgi:hypothetical protein